MFARTARGGGTVTNCTQMELETAMAGGGLVTLACDGTLPLTNVIVVSNSVTLDATGHALRISGATSNRLFSVEASAAFTLRNVTLAQGRIVGAKGQAGADAPIDDANSGSSGQSGQRAFGAAIENLGGFVSAFDCTFTNNTVVGGDGGAAGNGGGHFATGGGGGSGGNARGGALYSSAGGLVLSGCTFAANEATGGNGADGGAGGSAGFGADAGNGGNGGQAFGAAIYIEGGTLVLTNCTFYTNACAGGAAGNGGGASGIGSGGDGGTGGSGKGAAIYCASKGDGFILNCSFYGQTSAGGQGGDAGLNANGFNLNGDPGDNGGHAGAAIANAGSTVRLQNTIVAGSVGGSNAAGEIIDGGNNICSDDSCGFTISSSFNSLDPGIGTFTNAGGPTWTLTLATNSPAIDAGDPTSSPLTDQRGYYRHGFPDVGAFEFGGLTNAVSPAATISGISRATDGYMLRWSGPYAQRYQVQWTPRLPGGWQTFSNVVSGVGGQFEFADRSAIIDPADRARFYRLVPVP